MYSKALRELLHTARSVYQYLTSTQAMQIRLASLKIFGRYVHGSIKSLLLSMTTKDGDASG